MVNIETNKNFEIPKNTTQEKLANLSNDIFNEGNIDKLPYSEHERLKILTGRSDFNDGFLNVLNRAIPTNVLEKSQTQMN
ncbi:MAG: hypothetical protein PHH06_02930 [Candidatus Gracilibacteria bacterium]|nr:hypothetical protein [Candidatus Gracilibacteria bacterium]